ncbi:MAG: (d)CMP kinase [Erysipelotrichaceae bacterium]
MLINIAIDGPSAAGKSTIAKALAKRLNYTHIDTGAMYRAVALFAKRMDILEDPQAIVDAMMQKNIDFDEKGHIFLDEEDVSVAIREHEISMLTSNVSKFKLVRAMLVEKQQSMARKQGYILDGRDIGSVVLPNAQVKIYLVASVSARAKRRYDELLEKGETVNLADIENDIAQRDFQDMNRSESPLVQCEDAILVDTSSLSKQEVIETIYHIVKTKLDELEGSQND